MRHFNEVVLGFYHVHLYSQLLQQYVAFSSELSMEVTYIQYPNLPLHCPLSFFLSFLLSHLQDVSIINACMSFDAFIYILISILVLLYFTCIGTRQEVERKYRTSCISEVERKYRTPCISDVVLLSQNTSRYRDDCFHVVCKGERMYPKWPKWEINPVCQTI